MSCTNETCQSNNIELNFYRLFLKNFVALENFHSIVFNNLKAVNNFRAVDIFVCALGLGKFHKGFEELQGNEQEQSHSVTQLFFLHRLKSLIPAAEFWVSDPSFEKVEINILKSLNMLIKPPPEDHHKDRLVDFESTRQSILLICSFNIDLGPVPHLIHQITSLLNKKKRIFLVTNLVLKALLEAEFICGTTVSSGESCASHQCFYMFEVKLLSD